MSFLLFSQKAAENIFYCLTNVKDLQGEISPYIYISISIYIYPLRHATSIITLKFQDTLYFLTCRIEDLSTGGLSTGVVRTAMSASAFSPSLSQ